MPKTPKGIIILSMVLQFLVSEDAPFNRKDIITYLEKNNIETRAFMGGNLNIQPCIYRDFGFRVSGN